MQVWSLGWEDPLEEEMATHSCILAWKKKKTTHEQRAWWAIVHEVTKNWTWLINWIHVCTHTHTHTRTHPSIHSSYLLLAYVFGWLRVYFGKTLKCNTLHFIKSPSGSTEVIICFVSIALFSTFSAQHLFSVCSATGDLFPALSKSETAEEKSGWLSRRCWRNPWNTNLLGSHSGLSLV